MVTMSCNSSCASLEGPWRSWHGRAVSAQRLGLGALQLGVVGLLCKARATGAAALINATLQAQTEYYDQSKPLKVS